MMRKDILSDKRIRGIVFVIIVCLQLLFITYWARQKQNLFLDEEYTLEYASFYTNDDLYKTKLPYVGELQPRTWVEGKDLRHRFSVEPEESMFRLSPVQSVRLLFRRRSYFGLINIAESLLSPGRVSIMPAIVLNMIIFAGIQIVLYKILRNLRLREDMALWGVAFCGFSSLIVSHTVFIRFYTYTILLFMLVILLHQKMWEEKNTGIFILEEGTALILMYLSLKCSELTMIYGGAFVGMYLLMLMINKRWKDAAVYGLPMIGISLLYLGLKTDLLDVLLHPANYTHSSYAKSYTTSNLINITFESAANRITRLFHWAGKYNYGHEWILGGILLAILCMYVKKRDNIIRDSSRFLIFVMWITVLIYILFGILAGLNCSRYFLVVFMMLFIVLLYIVDRATKDISRQNIVRVILCVLFAVIMSITYGQRHVEYVYEEHRDTIRQLREHQDLDIVFVDCNPEVHHGIYDCVYNMTEHQHLFLMYSSDEPDRENIPDQVLVWMHGNRDAEPDFSTCLADYDVEFLGYTRDSEVYLAQRRDSNEQ